MRRLLLGVILVPGLAVFGFGIGGALGAALLVPPGAGLAAGATVALTGLTGACAAALAGTFLACRLAPRALLQAAIAALLLAAGVIDLAAWRIRRQNVTEPRPSGSPGWPCGPQIAMKTRGRF